jgi:hypothetical protein
MRKIILVFLLFALIGAVFARGAHSAGGGKPGAFKIGTYRAPASYGGKPSVNSNKGGKGDKVVGKGGK